MSDVGILNDFSSIVFVIMLIGSPGLAIGAILGALLWRRHRVIGCALGALIGGVLCFFGWAWFNDVI